MYLCKSHDGYKIHNFDGRIDVVDYFFFFQAEDGIRDYKVTGVQTCALPISRFANGGEEHAHRPAIRRQHLYPDQRAAHRAARLPVHRTCRLHREARWTWKEIGRASCRERV